MNTKVLLTFAAISLATVFSPATATTKGSAKPERSVAGVWTVTISPRNCVTSLPIQGAVNEGLFTFFKDGTTSAWTQNAAITVTRSPGHGLWHRERGWRKYSYAFVHLRYDGSGFFSGKQMATGTLELSENGNEFTAEGTNTIYDLEGHPAGTGCANILGTRFDP